MNWKKVAEEELKSYEDRKAALDNLSDRIMALQLSRDGLSSVVTDRVPVQGGASHIEDKLINDIVEIERLKLNYTALNRLVKLSDKALERLDDEELLVLRKFYIDPIPGCINELKERLGYEKSKIYNMRERALYKFTVGMYGMVDY